MTSDGKQPKPQRRRTLLNVWKGLLAFVLLVCLGGTVWLLPSLMGSLPDSSLPKTAPRFPRSVSCPTESTSTSSATAGSLRRIIFNKIRQHQSDHATVANHHAASSSQWLQGICSKLGPPGSTASSIWRNHAAEILKASIHPDDTQGAHAAWTEQLLKLMTPRLLQLSVRSIPHPDTWMSVLQKAETSYQQWRTRSKRRRRNRPKPEAVQVAVFGGSVTYGSYCHMLPPEVMPYMNASVPIPNTIELAHCSWLIRLQWLVDHIVGPNVVQIYNLAFPATNSETALPRIEYRLYDSWKESILSKRGPDVIVNTYATNDNEHFNWVNARVMADEFTSTSIGSRPCQRSAANRPLVLYVSDYVGLFDGFKLIDDHLRHVTVQQDAWYHVFGYISASNMLWHDLILPNTNETLVSPEWGSATEVHFQMPGHVARAWMVAYALLEWTLQACQDGEEHRLNSKVDVADEHATPQQLQNTEEEHPSRTNAAAAASNSSSKPSIQITSNPYHGINWTRRRHRHYYDASSELELDLWAPPLVSPVPLSNITNAWQQHVFDCDAAEQRKGCHENMPPCSFAFVASPGGTITMIRPLELFVKRVTKLNEGWHPELDPLLRQSKLGLSAQRPNARLVLRFENLVSPIQVLTFHYVKSYGTRWANSMARFTFSVWNTTKLHQQPPSEPQESSPKFSTTWQLQGFHDSASTTAYTFRKDVGTENGAEIGDVAELDIELIGGATFKIVSMMLCYR